MKPETVSLKPHKVIHVMGDSEILCTISLDNNGDMVFSFEHECPMSINTELLNGEHGPYLQVKALY